MLNKFFTVELVQIESKLHAYIASVEEGKYFHVSYELNQGTELKSKDVSVSLKRLVSNAEVDNANYKSIDLARDCLFSHALCQDKIEDKSLSLTSIIKVYKLDFKVKMVTASLTATTSSDGTKASLTIFLSQKITINESSKDGSIRTEVETGIGMNVGKKVLEDLTNVFIDFKRGSFLSAHFAKHDLLTKYSKFLTKEDQILSAAKSLYFYCEPETEEIKNFENFSSKMLEFYKEDKFYRISLTDDQGKLNFLFTRNDQVQLNNIFANPNFVCFLTNDGDLFQVAFKSSDLKVCKKHTIIDNTLTFIDGKSGSSGKLRV